MEGKAMGGRWRRAALLVLAAVLLAEGAPPPPAQAPAPKLDIEILNGDDVTYAIGRATPSGIRVQVRTETGSPAAGAEVRFEVAPSDEAAGGSFGGRPSVSVHAGADGIAEVRNFAPNAVAGEYWIRVTAVLGKRDGLATFTQRNAVMARSLKLTVVEGQNARHHVKGGGAAGPVVLVEDDAGKPVFGATVQFILPSSGPGALFAGGTRQVQESSDENGRAAAPRMRPSRNCGNYRIGAQARLASLSAALEIEQRNAGCGGGGKVAAVLLVVGGGAAAAAVCAQGKCGGSGSKAATPTAPPPAPPIALSPGAPNIGAPR